MAKLSELCKGKLEALRASLPPVPMVPEKPLPSIDETQLVGELLEWLCAHRCLKVEHDDLPALQLYFFTERDT